MRLNLNEFDFYVFNQNINQNQLPCSSHLFRSHHVTSIQFDSIHMRNIDAFDVSVKWVLLLFDLTILNDFRMTHYSHRQQFHLHMPQNTYGNLTLSRYINAKNGYGVKIHIKNVEQQTEK